MYSNIIKRSFQMLKNSDSYIGMDNSICKLLNILESIDEGRYINNIEKCFPDFELDEWISEHHPETFLGGGHGVLLPIDKNYRLFILLRIFQDIRDKSFEDYINRCYNENILSTGTDLILLLTGLYSGLKGNSQLNLQNMERHRKKEMEKVAIFNNEVSSEFERVLLDDLELKYPRNKAKVIMGDNFENISNSTIVNKSVLLDVMEKENSEELKRALMKLRKVVEGSNNEDAVGLFNDFLEELSNKTPQKRRLKSFWTSLVEVLPHIKNLTDISVGIASLIG